MATTQDGHQLVNVVKDGKVGMFRLRVQGKPLMNSKKGHKVNNKNDIWIYNAQKLGPTSQVQSATPSRIISPMRVVAPPQDQKKLPVTVTTSQRYVVAPPSCMMATSPHIFTTSQSRIVPGSRKILTHSPAPVTNVQIRTTTAPPTKSNNSNTSRKTLPQPRIFGNSLQQLQVTSCRYVDLDGDTNGVSLVDVDEESGSSDSKDDDFQCTECCALFTSEEELEKHESYHLGEVNYICDQCGKEFSTKSIFESHLKAHLTEKKFECDVCHKKFDYRDNLIFHMRIHGELRSYKCHVCNKKLGNKSVLNHHLLKHAAEKDNYAKPVLSDGKTTTTFFQQQEGELIIFSCDVCQKGFSNKVNLETHKLIHIRHERGPKLLGKRKTSPARESNQTTPLPQSHKYVCPKCNKGFYKEHYYHCHVSICVNTPSNETNPNAVKCAFCHKNYSLPSHAKDDGSQGMKFICEPCCTFLAQKSQFSGFTPRLENRFICNKCDKCFGNEDELRKHLDHHLPVKIYKCDKCEKCFGNENALQAHAESHTFSLKEKVEFNGKDFKSKNNIKKNSMKRKSPQKSPIKQWASPQKSPENKKGKISNGKSGNKGQRSKESKGPNKRNSDEELPSTSRESEGKRGGETTEHHIPQRRGKVIIEAARKRNYSSADILDSNSDIDVEGTEDYDPFMVEEGLPSLEVVIKQERVDLDEPEFDIMENCTVFNAAPSRDKTRTAFTIPRKVIKKEKVSDDEDEIGRSPIKKEKSDDDEMTIKEEHDMDFSGITIKEEKVEEEDFMMQDDFEFTPFGDPVKKEDLLHI